MTEILGPRVLLRCAKREFVVAAIRDPSAGWTLDKTGITDPSYNKALDSGRTALSVAAKVVPGTGHAAESRAIPVAAGSEAAAGDADPAEDGAGFPVSHAEPPVKGTIDAVNDADAPVNDADRPAGRAAEAVNHSRRTANRLGHPASCRHSTVTAGTTAEILGLS